MSTLNMLARKKTSIAMLKYQAKPKKIRTTNKQTNKQTKQNKPMRQQQEQKKKKKKGKKKKEGQENI